MTIVRKLLATDHEKGAQWLQWGLAEHAKGVRNKAYSVQDGELLVLVKPDRVIVADMAQSAALFTIGTEKTKAKPYALTTTAVPNDDTRRGISFKKAPSDKREAWPGRLSVKETFEKKGYNTPAATAALWAVTPGWGLFAETTGGDVLVKDAKTGDTVFTVTRADVLSTLPASRLSVAAVTAEYVCFAVTGLSGTTPEQPWVSVVRVRLATKDEKRNGTNVAGNYYVREHRTALPALCTDLLAGYEGDFVPGYYEISNPTKYGSWVTEDVFLAELSVQPARVFSADGARESYYVNNLPYIRITKDAVDVRFIKPGAPIDVPKASMTYWYQWATQDSTYFTRGRVWRAERKNEDAHTETPEAPERYDPEAFLFGAVMAAEDLGVRAPVAVATTHNVSVYSPYAHEQGFPADVTADVVTGEPWVVVSRAVNQFSVEPLASYPYYLYHDRVISRSVYFVNLVAGERTADIVVGSTDFEITFNDVIYVNAQFAGTTTRPVVQDGKIVVALGWTEPITGQPDGYSAPIGARYQTGLLAYENGDWMLESPGEPTSEYSSNWRTVATPNGVFAVRLTDVFSAEPGATLSTYRVASGAEIELIGSGSTPLSAWGYNYDLRYDPRSEVCFLRNPSYYGGAIAERTLLMAFTTEPPGAPQEVTVPDAVASGPGDYYMFSLLGNSTGTDGNTAYQNWPYWPPEVWRKFG